MALLTVEITGVDPEVEVAPQVALYVALEDRSNVLEVLAQIRTEVTEILYASEIATALI